LKSRYRLFSADKDELYGQENDSQGRSKDMKSFILMSIALAVIVFLTYRISGRAKGKPLFPPNLWIFSLIEKMFGENDSSKKVVKENGTSERNSGQNKAM
jgi:hypothetical protein